MTALLLYSSLVLMGLCVWISRVGNRRRIAMRKVLQDDGQELVSLQSRLLDAQRSHHLAREQISEIEGRIDSTRKALITLEGRLEQAKTAPSERYYIFDRMEPRHGAIWSVEICRAPDPLGPSRSEEATRCYLVAAASRREAEERVAQRFPRSSGYSVGMTVPCRLFGDRNTGGHADNEAVPAEKERSLRAQRMPS